MLFTTFISSALAQLNGIVVLACFVSRYLALDSFGKKKSLLFISRFPIFVEQALGLFANVKVS